MPEVRHVYPDLVSAPRLEIEREQRALRKFFIDAVMRARAPSVCGDRHLFTVACASRDRRIHRAAHFLHVTDDERAVFAAHRVIRKLSAQAFVREIVLRRGDKSRSLSVDPVDYAGARHSADPGKLAAAPVEQSGDERSRIMPRRGVNDHAGRLVYHDYVAVLIDHVERYVLRLRLA